MLLTGHNAENSQFNECSSVYSFKAMLQWLAKCKIADSKHTYNCFSPNLKTDA